MNTILEANAETLMHIHRVQSLLRDVVDNLIRRAVQHAANGSRTRIVAQRETRRQPGDRQP